MYFRFNSEEEVLKNANNTRNGLAGIPIFSYKYTKAKLFPVVIVVFPASIIFLVKIILPNIDF